MPKKFIILVLVFLIFSGALFIRIYFCYNKVFSDPIKYAADDGVYHMRLVENQLLGGHFPRRIYFDPFTYFPYGTYNNVAPLFDHLIAWPVWIFSFGKPTLESINKIAPFLPVFLGSLVIFIAYFIGKSLWNKKAGIFSAFLIAISSPFLQKSLLGSTDHHVAEVLFSSLAMMFFIFTLKSEKYSRKFWTLGCLTGFSLGLYFLVWSGAMLFLFIVFSFVVLYYLINYLKGHNPLWVLYLGGLCFSIVLAMIFLFFGQRFFFINEYNIKQFLSLVLGILGFIILGATGNILRKKEAKAWVLFLLLIIISAVFITFLKIFVPFVFNNLLESFMAIRTGLVFNNSAREMVSEMSPLGIRGAIDYFSSLLFLAFGGLTVLIYRFLKKRKPQDLLVIVWMLIIILMTGIIPVLGSLRYSYYLSFLVSFLSAIFVIAGFEFGWKALKYSQNSSPSHIKPYFLVGSLLIIFNIVFFLLFPFPFNLGTNFPYILPDILRQPYVVAQETIIRAEDWYETLRWIKENTPDPGLDYYALYNEESFSYPEESYGILALWDVGHMITYYAHRIPNANPFQEGIGRKLNDKIEELGQAVFFLETEEDKAIEYLDKMKTKYVIVDYSSANPQGVFYENIKWVQGNFEGYWLEGEEATAEPNKIDNSIVVRLYLLDGREETTERDVNGEKIQFYIKPLRHFRLIYESKTTAIKSEEQPKGEVKMIKVFEYVKGAKITGRAKIGEEAVISIKIKTNQEREFEHIQRTQANSEGYFEFIVPYAGGYNLKIGNKEKSIKIEEKDILEGKTVSLLK